MPKDWVIISYAWLVDHIACIHPGDLGWSIWFYRPGFRGLLDASAGA